MNGKNLLDTNIIIGLLNSEENTIQGVKNSSEILIPVIALGELYYGAYNSAKMQENISKISSLSNTVSIIKCDSSTSKHYGKIKAELKKKGKPIPENDIWIAALAIQYTATLVTKDKHFKNIDGLQIESW